MFRCINTHKKKISMEIKFTDVWKRCFCGRSTKMLLASKQQCCHVGNSDLFFNIDFGRCVINYVVLLLVG